MLGALGTCLGVAVLVGHLDEMAALTLPMPPPPPIRSAPSEAVTADSGLAVLAEEIAAPPNASPKAEPNPGVPTRLKAVRLPEPVNAPVVAHP